MERRLKEILKVASWLICELDALRGRATSFKRSTQHGDEKDRRKVA